MAAPASVAQLVQKFRQESGYLKAASTKEHLIRRAYIDPLFSALGWDLDYSKEGPLVHREVIEEDALRVEGAMKAPDYGFYLGGQRKFFVEAKKPSVNLHDGKAAAFQVRRYGWSARLPLSIITDFEEFGVYDCRVQPDPEDRSSAARIMFMGYEEYPDRWDELADLFSRDAVLSGSLEAFEQEKSRRGTNPVDKAFLAEIEGWRESLAKEIYKRNRWLSRRDLNYAVQMTIDRLVFLRICEDRGIEDYGRFEELLDRGGIYEELLQVFRDADDRYNSGLFHFREEKGREESPDGLTPELEIDDAPLKRIIRRLYYPQSPYQFSVMPVEILGQVYEQFLGKVIDITPRDSAVVEEKPEVRKAGGVFYTPAYIVNHIVEKTVGKLVEGKTPRQVSNLKIVDPACGSGSFLVGAYDYLLDWHRRWYVWDGPEKNRRILYTGPGGEWRLVNEEKKRILKNNIFGVDIDTQAVEVTKLSLLLKVLEGETDQSVTRQLSGMQERVLPDLDDNIKCGNSLIGSDFYDRPQSDLLEDEEQYRINVFDWEDAFPAVLSGNKPGFDAVIGNPPYVRPHKLEPHEKEYFWSHYKTFEKKSDLYCCFIEKGLNLLMTGGHFGFIISNGFLRLDSFEALRRFILDNASIRTIVEFPYNVFEDATVKTAILTLSKGSGRGEVVQTATSERPLDLPVLSYRGIPQEWFRETYKAILDLSLEESNERIKKRLRETSAPLGTSYELSFGLKTGDDSKFLSHEQKNNKYKPLLRGEDVARYSISFKGEYVWYDPARMREHRRTARPGDKERFEQPKVLVRDTGEGLRATFDDENYYVKDVLIISDPDKEVGRLKVLTGVLNSRLMRFYYETSFPTLHVQRDELASLPILDLDSTDSTREGLLEQVAAQVEKALGLRQRASAAKSPADRTFLRRQIDLTDRRIDRLVYDLYGLTDEEIEIVESETAPGA